MAAMPEEHDLTLKILSEKSLQFGGEGVVIKSQSLQEGAELLYELNLERGQGASRARIRWS